MPRKTVEYLIEYKEPFRCYYSTRFIGFKNKENAFRFVEANPSKVKTRIVEQKRKVLKVFK